VSKIVTLREAEGGMVGARSWGEGEEESIFNKSKFSVNQSNKF
jgi:hypothetical protein